MKKYANSLVRILTSILIVDILSLFTVFVTRGNFDFLYPIMSFISLPLLFGTSIIANIRIGKETFFAYITVYIVMVIVSLLNIGQDTVLNLVFFNTTCFLMIFDFFENQALYYIFSFIVPIVQLLVSFAGVAIRDKIAKKRD
ncbi:MAG: hypothetical protein ACI4IR_07100 [Eubacterium sp.]